MLQPKIGTAHAAMIRYAVVLLGGLATILIILELFNIAIGQLLVGGAFATVLLGTAAQRACPTCSPAWCWCSRGRSTWENSRSSRRRTSREVPRDRHRDRDHLCLPGYYGRAAAPTHLTGALGRRGAATVQPGRWPAARESRWPGARDLGDPPGSFLRAAGSTTGR